MIYTCGKILDKTSLPCGKPAELVANLPAVKGVRRLPEQLYLCRKHAERFRPDLVSPINVDYADCDNPPGSE